MMIWCDVETTGLDPGTLHLLEVGFVVTEGNFKETGRISFVIKQPVPIMSLIGESSPIVQEMHSQNGLWKDLANKHPLIDQAESMLINWIELITHGRKFPLCGNTVPFDRACLRRHMPRLDKLFHYRNIDVSTVKELYNRFAPAGDGYDKPPNEHRVLADLDGSIAELRFYLDKMGWVP